MITTIAIILLVLWVLGFIGIYAIGNLVHLFLAVAVILILIRIFR